MPARATDLALDALTARQGNLFTVTQAERCGLHRNTVLGRVESGRYRRGDDGLLRLAGSAQAPMEDVWRAVLLVGGDAIVARHTAARLHGLSPAPRSEVVHLLVHQRSFIETPSGVRVHRAVEIDERWDVAEVDGIRCTSVARTLCDLSRDVPPGLLVAMVNDAVRKGLTDVVELRTMAARLGRFRWKTRLLGILDRLAPQAADANNATESRFLELCHEHGLPLLGINVPLRDASGRQRYVDALFRRVDGRLVPVEVDGHRTHWTRIDRWHDEQREELLGAANPRLEPFVRIGADQVWHAPDDVVRRLQAAVDGADPSVMTAEPAHSTGTSGR